MIEKMAFSYKGMTPMERFLMETCQVCKDIPNIGSGVIVSDCAATICPSMEGEVERNG
jgi:hypothetical protein